jgi:hypothetical protein
MKIAARYSYRHALSILEEEFPSELTEVFNVLKSVDFIHLKEKRTRSRGGKVVAVKSISSPETNERISTALKKKGWAITPKIISKSESNLAADAKKGKIQIEVQFGNMARWYTDVFKFLLSYSADDIEVGILVVPTQKTAGKIDENVAYYERVVRELPHAKMGITIPILVIGVSD